jgi:SAM-dependent methyltransferase
MCAEARGVEMQQTEPPATVAILPIADRDDPTPAEEYLPAGIHLVGSVPLNSAEDVFRIVAATVGDRLRRMPDGETGPRSDWILWQYPVFSSRPQFEVGPPGEDAYRTLPKLRLRSGETAAHLTFGNLGYAESAIASYRSFAALKRDGVIPPHCRFQLCLPTPLAPVSAFVAPEHRAQVEPAYEARVLEELAAALAAIPADQLAVQWDARLEFAMLEGITESWFGEVRSGVLERLLRLSRHIPAEVDLGFHLCYGDEAHGHFVDPQDTRKMVDVANALASSLGRPLNWLHMPVPHDADDAYFAPLADLRLDPRTELYLGVLRLDDGVDGARARIATARRHVDSFGAASDCGWGRGGPAAVADLLGLHRAMSRPLPQSLASGGFAWPPDFVRVPDDAWTRQEVHEAGLAYDDVDDHGWYSNLDRIVDSLSAHLRDGDLLMDYSGGTGILLDRLRLRIFDRMVGVLIVDASAKFLRVALEKYRDDPLVAMRLLRFLREERRLQGLDEVLGPELLQRGVDSIAVANAIHLYPDLVEVADAWSRALRPGGKVFICSGNLRNPRAAAGEWILDETVWVINDIAEGLVRSDPRYERYRLVLDDTVRMAAHAAQRDKVFLKPRPLGYYTDTLNATGLTVTEVGEETIVADVEEWFAFLAAYHDAVLGWVGGTKKLDGSDPSPAAVEDRLAVMRAAMDTIFGGRRTFNACWTYITCERTG